jgi:predicted ATPase
MLKRLYIHNFRTYMNATLSFERRHLVIGSNNSGKSNFAAALKFLAACTLVELSKAADSEWIPGGIWELRNRYWSSDIVELGCDCTLFVAGEPHEYEYRLGLEISTDLNPMSSSAVLLKVHHERLTLNAPGFEATTLLENDGRTATVLHEESHLKGSPEPLQRSYAPTDATLLCRIYEHAANQRLLRFRRFLSRWHYFQLSPPAMRIWLRDNWSTAPLGEDGSNLASVVYRIKNRDELRYRKIIDHVRLLEPDLELINFDPTPDNRAIPTVRLKGAKQAVSWQGLSDGTLRALAMASIIELSGADDDNPAVVLIEEPENGIAPGHMRAIFDLFEERAPNSQFIFTSHSPYFINMFDGQREAVTLLRRKVDRTTEVASVAEERADVDRFTLADEYALELLQ